MEAPSYIASLQSNTRQRPIPWEGAVRAGTVTEAQLLKIQTVSKAKQSQKREIVESDLAGYSDLFVGQPGNPSVIETAAKRTDIVQYVLVLMGDLLSIVPPLGKALFRNANPYTHLLPLISRVSHNAEDPIPLLTATVLSALMEKSKDESAATKEALPILLTYLSGLVNSMDPARQDLAVSQYSRVLYSRTTRQIFWSMRNEVVRKLFDILRFAGGITGGNSTWSGSTQVREQEFEGPGKGDVGIQLLYHILLVLWQLSFDAAEIGDEMHDAYDVIGSYTVLLRLTSKVKITRLLMATLLNLISANEDTLLPAAMLAGLPGVLANLSKRQLNDDELQQDMASLRELLEEYAADKTTFDEYVAELRSGHLRWSPPHRNENFWKENARKITEYNHGELLTRLAEIARQPWDNDKAVLAIVCNDVGFLVREVPERRGRLEKLGLKTRIMELMQEEDDAIRWESLRAVGGWLKFRGLEKSA